MGTVRLVNPNSARAGTEDMARLIDLHAIGYACFLSAEVGENSAGRHITFDIDLDSVDVLCRPSVRDV